MLSKFLYYYYHFRLIFSIHRTEQHEMNFVTYFLSVYMMTTTIKLNCRSLICWILFFVYLQQTETFHEINFVLNVTFSLFVLCVYNVKCKLIKENVFNLLVNLYRIHLLLMSCADFGMKIISLLDGRFYVGFMGNTWTKICLKSSFFRIHKLKFVRSGIFSKIVN